jgi:hypothetical protein
MVGLRLEVWAMMQRVRSRGDCMIAIMIVFELQSRWICGLAWRLACWLFYSGWLRWC